MKLTPHADRVIVRRDTEEERKIGNIILPQSAWLEYAMGTVVEVGPGPCGETGRCVMTSKPGDRVIFPPSLAREVPVRAADGYDVTYHVIRQHEISLTVDEEKSAA